MIGAAVRRNRFSGSRFLLRGSDFGGAGRFWSLVGRFERAFRVVVWILWVEEVGQYGSEPESCGVLLEISHG